MSTVSYNTPHISPFCTIRHRSSDIDLNEDEQTLSYYGGLKGQFVHFKDGKLVKISGNEKKTGGGGSRQGSVAANSQIAPTVNERENVNDHKTTFEDDFNKIQHAAARLVAIQELAKRKGNFSPEDNRVYATSLLELGQAAQNLAMLQQTGQIHDFSVLLHPTQSSQMSQKTPINSDKGESNEITMEPAMQAEKVNEVTEHQLSESELLQPNLEDPYEDVNDSVAVTPPKKDASVAEARPVGFSIAGEGGVASAKPNAIALSGRNGLAVSAPKATALAGVTAEEAAAFSISIPSRHNLVIKTASSRLPFPTYDDYDDIDTSPLQAKTRNVPLLRSADSEKTKAKPMQATINAADAIIKMWRTALADDNEQYLKNFKQTNQLYKN